MSIRSSMYHYARLCAIVALLIAVADAAMARHIGKDKKVSARIVLAQDRMRSGSEGVAMVILNIQSGWHINSASPSDENLIATSVEIEGVDSVVVNYPEGTLLKFDFSETPLDVYEGTINIPIRFRTMRKPGTYSIPVVVHYQACSNSICLAPASVRVNVRLQVVSQKGRVSRINKELFQDLDLK